MRSTSREISFYVDTMIVETLLTDSHLVKSAQAGGFISGLIGKVKDYFGAHFNSENKAGSVINMLAPGVISIGLGAMGLPWLGAMLAFAASIFNINVSEIIESIWNGIKGIVSSGKQTSSEHIDSLVDSSISSNIKPATQDEADKAKTSLESRNSAQLLRDAKLLKMAMIAYEESPENFVKQAGLLDWFSGKKAGVGSLLGIVLKWVFKIVLASAGFMVAGDIVNKVLDRPNALDGTLKDGKPTTETSVAMPVNISKQTRFKVNPGAQDISHKGSSWIENVQNSEGGISNMLMSWAKEIYQGLNGLDSIIQNTAGFQAAVEAISWQNHSSAGGPIVYIPPMFTSKKMVVDHFIDEVAEKAPK